MGNVYSTNMKFCNSCNQNIVDDNFTSGKAVCKDCRAKQRRQKYSSKKQTDALKNRPPDEVLDLCRILTSFSNYCMTPGSKPSVMKKYANDVMGAVDDIIEENNTFKFQINVSPDLRRFIKKCLDNSITSSMMRRVFIDYDNEDVMQTFGYSRDELDDMVRDDLEDHQLMLDAVRQAYICIIDKKQMEIRNDKLDRSCDVYYDHHDNILTVDNSLQITQDEFIDFIKFMNTIEKPPISLVGFVDHKLFDRFLNSITDKKINQEDMS